MDLYWACITVPTLNHPGPPSALDREGISSFAHYLPTQKEADGHVLKQNLCKSTVRLHTKLFSQKSISEGHEGATRTTLSARPDYLNMYSYDPKGIQLSCRFL